VEAVRGAAGNDPRPVADLLYDLGDTADLRAAAAQDDMTAADDFAHLLAERGDLAELRRRADAGHRLAADLLAELLATHRRTDELHARAAAGDQAAAIRLGRLDDEPAGGVADPCARIRDLREALNRGDTAAAEPLTSLLYELGDEAELRVEVDAGTRTAADRLLALLMANGCDDPAAVNEVTLLRAFGVHCDGTPARTRGIEHG
jgi:hypothetical protein